jgi:hypothetical protein
VRDPDSQESAAAAVIAALQARVRQLEAQLLQAQAAMPVPSSAAAPSGSASATGDGGFGSSVASVALDGGQARPEVPRSALRAQREWCALARVACIPPIFHELGVAGSASRHHRLCLEVRK